MTVFGLVHGSWQGAWVWGPLITELEHRGHRGIAVDMPAHDIQAGASQYADKLFDALRDVTDDVVLVGHSLGGLSIPLLPARRPVRALVFLAAGIPRPRMTYAAQVQQEGIREQSAFDQTAKDEHGCTILPYHTALDVLYNACKPEVAHWAADRLRYQAQKPMTEVTPLTRWPDVSCAYIACHGDRVINADWQVRAAQDRFGADPYEMFTDHSPMLSATEDLADILLEIQA
ncbi:MAG: alpha/beta fold hydrolase [Nitriliruptorales bacterium]|nr:alpha/beta fold hydrolase [Nitriliruptorales bacterium]